MKVKCINIEPIDLIDYSYCRLTLQNIYYVIGLAHDAYDDFTLFEVIDDMGLSDSVQKRRFEIIDDTLEEGWQYSKGESREWYDYPEIHDMDMEKYYENDKEVVEFYHSFIKTKYEEKFGPIEAIETYPG